uniref:Uncharacterized protein n=1 Tax=Anguilla anguilla TaxID=7936 RepID=A0A0E9SU02_ANGAN
MASTSGFTYCRSLCDLYDLHHFKAIPVKA